MTRIHGSSQTFLDAADDNAMEFLNTVSDITANPEYQQLKNYVHHNCTNRYQHCLNVAWYTFLWCKKAGLNYKSAARGAMCHDFYLYDNAQFYKTNMRHSVVHPRYALLNTRLHFETDPVMEDCIVHHMWPAGSGMPTTPEGMIVTLADKYCASVEWGQTQAQKAAAYERIYLSMFNSSDIRSRMR